MLGTQQEHFKTVGAIELGRNQLYNSREVKALKKYITKTYVNVCFKKESV